MMSLKIRQYILKVLASVFLFFHILLLLCFSLYGFIPKNTAELIEFLFDVRLTPWVLSINCEDSIIHDSVTFRTGWNGAAVLIKQKLFMNQDLGIINPVIYW